MQAIFANFPNKLTLNFPQNIVHQIFHEMSNILYIFRFSRFSNFSADFPQLYRIQIFQIFQTAESFRRFSASSFPDFPLSARFSADFSACQIFRMKKSTLEFSRVPCCYAVSITRMQLLTFVCCPSSKTT